MIQDVDETLKELLIRAVPLSLDDVDIKFDMPTPEWAGHVTEKPAVNLFLYDLRENVELRSADAALTRTGSTGTRRRAPFRLDLSYLITVWAREIDDEHRLLGEVLTGLLRHPVLPTEVMRGSMQNQPLPVRAWIALPERTPNPWDIWGHLEQRMKPGLSYVVTVSLEPHAIEPVRMPTQRVFEIEMIEPQST